MDKVIVTIIGTGLIGIIWWFFFGKKEEGIGNLPVKKDREGNLNVDMVVDGGYKPAVIFLEKGKNAKIKIVRKDTSTCLSDVIFPDFKISKYLPLNKQVEVEIKPEKTGEYPFHCGMNMFHGKIIVS